jgi:hypothetical protein
MLFIDRTGVIKYRTRLIRDLNAAVRFSRALHANSRFCDVETVTSNQSKNPAWYVTYRPVNEKRQDALTERLQAERVKRCKSEMPSYLWSNGEREGFSYVTTKSGSTYHVSAASCTCTDFNETCQDIGIICKHILAFNLREGDPFAEDADIDPFAEEGGNPDISEPVAALEGPFTTFVNALLAPEPAPPTRAEIEARMKNDFPD